MRFEVCKGTTVDCHICKKPINSEDDRVVVADLSYHPDCFIREYEITLRKISNIKTDVFADIAEKKKEDASIYHKCSRCGEYFVYNEKHPCENGDDGQDYRYCPKCETYYDDENGHNCKKDGDGIKMVMD